MRKYLEAAGDDDDTDEERVLAQASKHVELHRVTGVDLVEDLWSRVWGLARMGGATFSRDHVQVVCIQQTGFLSTN